MLNSVKKGYFPLTKSTASIKISIRIRAEYTWVLEGFQTTVFPIIAGAVGRLAAMDVKLNG